MQARSVQNKTCKLLCEVVGKVRIEPKRLRSVLSTLKDFRNICAHGERLFSLVRELVAIYDSQTCFRL